MFKKSLLALGLTIATTASIAYADDCSANFVNGKAPTVTSQNLAQKTTSLCFEQYAVLYSGVTRTPLWSAEYLTADRIKEAKKLKRMDKFHEENQLPYADRSLLSDYKGSIKVSIERGHMSPNSDFSTYSAQGESYSLANIIPQNADNNENLWEGIESATRKLVLQRQRLYVITGPIFDNTNSRLNGHVTIPTRIFKVIIDPSRMEGAAYITPNAPGMDYETVSVAELEKIVGFNLFPALGSNVKANKMNLPAPTPYKGGSGDRNSSRESRYSHPPSAMNQVDKVISRFFK